MNRPVWLALVLACLVAPVAAPAPGLKDDKGDKLKAELKKLEGDWVIESWTQIGQQIPMQATWSFKGDKYTLEQGTNTEEGSIKLDPDKKPAVLDLDITGGSCAGKQQPGIYKFDGDTLICCFAWPGTTDRPTEFESTPGNRWILITLKRKK
jgi:uncharacterized protein (TIGR03067 family)